MCSTQYTLLWTLNSTAGKNFELLWILLLRCDWPVQKTLHNQSWSLVQERSGWAPVTTIFLLSSCSAQILHKSTARLQTTESTMGCSDVLRAALPVHYCSGPPRNVIVITDLLHCLAWQGSSFFTSSGLFSPVGSPLVDRNLRYLPIPSC